jgi:hypothetical protein
MLERATPKKGVQAKGLFSFISGYVFAKNFGAQGVHVWGECSDVGVLEVESV